MAADSNLASMTPRSEAVFAVTIVVFTCATIFVSLRLLSRMWIVRKVSLDDYFILTAWVIALGLSTSICYGATVGLGRHEVSVPDFWQAPLKKSQYAFSVLYNPALMAEKTSILVFYLSLSNINKTFRWATIGTLFVVNAAGLALTLVTIFQCHPVDLAWKANSTCSDIITIYLSSAPVNIITDLAILLLPMPILTGMRLPKKQKLILVITFGFGIFVAAVDVVRIAYLQNAFSYRLGQLQKDAQASNTATNSTDFSWYASFSFMWSAIEVNVGIMCACVPALKPLVSRFLPHLVHDDDSVTRRLSSDQTAKMAAAQRIPSIPEGEFDARDSGHSEAAEDSTMGMMDFLTTPGMNETDMHNRIRRTDTVLTNTTRNTAPGTPTFFDFVNMKGKRSMVQMSNRESLFPVAMVTVLFFIWGFEYGLLDVLNTQFQAVAHQSAGQAVGIHSAYYAGYFVGPLVFGRLVLKHWGFKACYTVGLAIYACGALIFWPAAVLTSYPTFVVVNFIVGLGLSILEVAANPFIALCGPPQYAEIRLNLSQGFQAVGTVVAPLIANKSFAKNTMNSPSLINTQWAYLGISLFTIALAVAYYYLPLPEATDIEIEDASECLGRANHAPFFSTQVPLVYVLLALGVLSQFCYVGAQETIATPFNTYLTDINPSLDTTNYMAIAHACFAASRFLAAGLGFFIPPRVLLLIFYVGAIAFSAAAMSTSGNAAIAMLILVFFFEGPLFSLIFAQSLRGMGRHTKIASVFITSAISGGAVFPAISYAVAESRGTQYALCIAVAAFATGTLYPIFLNSIPAAKRIVDPRIKSRSNDNNNSEKDKEPRAKTETPDSGGIKSNDSSATGSRTSRVLIVLGKSVDKVRRFSIVGAHHDDGSTEWREGAKR